MPREREPARVLGPYQEKQRCRVVVVENGRRENHFAPDWESAMRLFGRLRRQLAKRSAPRLGELLDAYKDHRLAAGTAKQQTIEHADARIRIVLGAWLDEEASALTPDHAARIYEDHRTKLSRRGIPYAAASHRWDLKITRAFFRWAVRERRVAADPFAGVKLVGKAKAGKLQLRLDEARRWSDVALAAFEEGNPLALAGLLALWLGLRASEALLRQVRDVDDGGRVLWIPSGKTENARRRLVVPEALRGQLLRQAGGRGPSELLFVRADGRGFRRTALNRTVGALCRRAGVPVVCPHGLRGLHSTLALGAGATSEAVAAALGHGSFAMTQRHYVAPGVVEAAAAARVAGALEGGATELLRGLDEATLRELLALLEERKRGR